MSEPSYSLLDDVLAYCRRTGTATSTFGKLAAGDPALVERMCGRRQLGRPLARPKLAEKVRLKLDELKIEERAKAEASLRELDAD